ncbi:hemagglutinin repeat-containing protein [Rahnella variigena]|uniref:hemagglutinin repeat-containing protein n=1 Tax=Rahnella variigena TaxID=574964 RepID=UPI003D29AAF6
MRIFADVNAAAGKNHGDGTTWTNSEIGAGNNLNINAGNDLNIRGAQVSGEQITAEIGHQYEARIRKPRWHWIKQSLNLVRTPSNSVYQAEAALWKLLLHYI